jgi:hypothetical protein
MPVAQWQPKKIHTAIHQHTPPGSHMTIQLRIPRWQGAQAACPRARVVCVVLHRARLPWLCLSRLPESSLKPELTRPGIGPAPCCQCQGQPEESLLFAVNWRQPGRASSYAGYTYS